MLLLSSCAGTHCAAPFLLLLRKGSLHFTASSGTNSCWTNMKFCSLSDQILLFNRAFEIAWNSQQNERQDISKFCLFFFHKVYLENVNKIVHFICCCIRHSVLFRTVFMICINDFCNGGTIKVSDCVQFEQNTRVTTQQSTARPTALTMAVASKAVIDALYHQTFHFCF